MSPEDEKRVADELKEINHWLCQIAWILVVGFLVLFLAGTCRADTTKVFQAIEKPKPTVCQKVCPVCGNCIPRFIRKQLSWSTYGEPVPMVFRCTNRRMIADTSAFARQFTTPGCDSIIWGRYRTICRVDTANCKWDSLKIYDSINVPQLKGESLHEWLDRRYSYPRVVPIQCVETIFTDDPRCGKHDTSFVVGKGKLFYHDTIPVVRARGLDSCFSLGCDSANVFFSKPRWLYRIKHSKDTTFREADELLKKEGQ